MRFSLDQHPKAFDPSHGETLRLIDVGAHAGTAFDGTILRTIDSNRFVTGVIWVDGQLWHGTQEGDESVRRRK